MRELSTSRKPEFGLGEPRAGPGKTWRQIALKPDSRGNGPGMAEAAWCLCRSATTRRPRAASPENPFNGSRHPARFGDRLHWPKSEQGDRKKRTPHAGLGPAQIRILHRPGRGFVFPVAA